MLTLRLRWSLIDERIKACGGTLEVQRRSRMHRSTISRWRNKGSLPDDPLQFLRLADALGIDPLLLFDLDEKRFGQTCFEIGKLLLTGRLGSALKSLEFIRTFWSQVSNEDWPPPCIAGSSETMTYRWHSRDFVHDGQLGLGPEGRNFYASVALRGPRIETRTAPQIWYFAYRDHVPWESRWNPYGAVALVGHALELYAFQGEKFTTNAPGPIAVQTWFGEGDAVFRVASLHPFTLDVTRELPRNHSAVRFSLPSFRMRG